MNKCKKCDRDTLHAGDKYCGACVHNAYAELEAENAKLREAAQAVVKARKELGECYPHHNEYADAVVADMFAHKELAAALEGEGE